MIDNLSTDYKLTKIRVKSLVITCDNIDDKPYYSIIYYDSNKNELYKGYGSYDLKIVLKSIEDCFEFTDCDNLDGDTNNLKK